MGVLEAKVKALEAVLIVLQNRTSEVGFQCTIFEEPGNRMGSKVTYLRNTKAKQKTTLKANRFDLGDNARGRRLVSHKRMTRLKKDKQDSYFLFYSSFFPVAPLPPPFHLHLLFFISISHPTEHGSLGVCSKLKACHKYRNVTMSMSLSYAPFE